MKEPSIAHPAAQAAKPGGAAGGPGRGALPEAPDPPGSGNDEEREHRRCLSLFLHPNEDVYLEYYDKYFQDGRKSHLVLSWHWPAFLVVLPWLLYRKLYLWAVGFLLVAPLVRFALLLVVSEGVADTVGQGAFMAVFAIFAKRIYVNHALRRIRKIDERNPTSAERDSYLERAGGVSIPGVVFGLIVLFSLMVLPALVGQ